MWFDWECATAIIFCYRWFYGKKAITAQCQRKPEAISEAKQMMEV